MIHLLFLRSFRKIGGGDEDRDFGADELMVAEDKGYGKINKQFELGNISFKQ
jgi:hypothetical protein